MTNLAEIENFEERHELIKVGENIYEGKYPLIFIAPTSRGVFGGDFVAQGILAAWETVEDKELTLHSLHSYFLKAGSKDTPMVWKVTRTNDGRNFANRQVQCYQKETGKLCFTINISFVRNNSTEKKKQIHAQNPVKNIPIGFQKGPGFLFEKYKRDLQNFTGSSFNNDIKYFVPPEYFEERPINPKISPALSKFGYFFKCNYNWSKANEPEKVKASQVAFASDSFWLMTLPHTFGRPFGPMKDFFSVSLDHSMHFHDTNYDPSGWLYVEYNFSRLVNDRVLAHCQIFNAQGVAVISFNQEALVYFPNDFVENFAKGYKL